MNYFLKLAERHLNNNNEYQFSQMISSYEQLKYTTENRKFIKSQDKPPETETETKKPTRNRRKK